MYHSSHVSFMQVVPIVLCCDSRSILHLDLLVHSIKTNVPGAQLYLITDREGVFAPWAHKIGVCSFSLPKTPFRRITHHMWYRCMIPDIFPELERCIYLDFDTLVLKDIGSLLEGDFVLRAAYYNGDIFNSGVLAFNFTAECKELLKECLAQASESTFDQDIMNKVFRGKVDFVDQAYNATADLYGAVVSDPIVVHYLGELKPWHLHIHFKHWFRYAGLF